MTIVKQLICSPYIIFVNTLLVVKMKKKEEGSKMVEDFSFILPFGLISYFDYVNSGRV